MFDDYDNVQEEVDKFFTPDILELLAIIKNPPDVSPLTIEDLQYGSKDKPLISIESVIAWATIKKQLRECVAHGRSDSVKHGILNKIQELIV